MLPRQLRLQAWWRLATGWWAWARQRQQQQQPAEAQAPGPPALQQQQQQQQRRHPVHWTERLQQDMDAAFIDLQNTFSLAATVLLGKSRQQGRLLWRTWQQTWSIMNAPHFDTPELLRLWTKAVYQSATLWLDQPEPQAEQCVEPADNLDAVWPQPL